MSILSSSKCVFLLSDEGLSIYDASATRAALIESIPWNTQDFEEAVVEIVRKECRGKKILLLNDMVEQHYRKERIPKASPFDKANILKRRVSAAFPSYPVRSAIKLKEKALARDGQTSGGDIYLLAAVPLYDNVRKTISALQKTYSSVAGFCLLPVESASMVHALSKKLVQAGDKQAAWTVFVGQHQNGGLRQIVTKNGELALTRMTPIVDTDIDQDLWCTEVVGELKGTMSYLARFGFDSNDGLDVIIMANNSVADKIAAKVDFECNLNVLTAIEAAGMLGVRIGRQEDERYADPLHIAWSGKKSSYTMPLQAAQLENISRPAQTAMAASIALLLACGYFGYETFKSTAEFTNYGSELTVARQTLSSAQSEHKAELDKKAAIGIDFDLISSSTQVYDKVDKETMKPLRVLSLVGAALGPDIHITSLDARPVGSAKPGEPAVAAPVAATPEAGAENGTDLNKPTEYELVIKIVFPAKLSPEVGVKEIRALEERLRKNLPEHQVSIIKQVADLSYTGNFVGEASNVKPTEDTEKKDYEAQIMIKGALI